MRKTSVIVCETLHDVVEYITKKHSHLQSMKGVYALKLLRQADGSRIPFEEMSGIRIKKFTIFTNNTLILEQHSHGYTYKNQNIQNFDARLYLSNLAMINIYDYSAEFLTIDSIDFTYIEQSKEARVVMMSEWINEEPGILRAQWFMDDDIDKILDRVGLRNRTRRLVASRNLDLDIRL